MKYFNMKLRIILKSFNKNLINLISKKLYSNLIKTNSKVTGFVSLPTKKKRFCILRSPHIDKDSREHFELRIFKRFLDLTTSSYLIFNSLLKFKVPTGILFKIQIINFN